MGVSDIVKSVVSCLFFLLAAIAMGVLHEGAHARRRNGNVVLPVHATSVRTAYMQNGRDAQAFLYRICRKNPQTLESDDDLEDREVKKWTMMRNTESWWTFYLGLNQITKHQQSHYFVCIPTTLCT